MLFRSDDNENSSKILHINLDDSTIAVRKKAEDKKLSGGRCQLETFAAQETRHKVAFEESSL